MAKDTFTGIRKDIVYLSRDMDRLGGRFDKFEEKLDGVLEEMATMRERQRYWNYGLGILNLVLTAIVSMFGIRKT